MLRRIYHKLPIIRELKHINEQLTSISSLLSVNQVSHIQLTDYQEKLLSKSRYANSKNLNRYEFQIFSQFGEDGIIAEIFRRIGTETQTFLEIGVGDGLENNTTFLLFQGWSGFWIEANEKLAQLIFEKLRVPISQRRLKLEQAFVTAENITDIISRMQVPKNLDLLSIDIDRNTYWSWEALPNLRPRVVVVEYNAQMPPQIDWKAEYVADKFWNKTIYFGASLKAYELLGRKYGYSLVGCTLSGVNAFFVRNDLCRDKFEEPFTAEHHFEPARYFLYRKTEYKRCFSDL